MDKYDVIVLGATGYTGLRVCEYLQDRAKETGQTWAVAGRSADTLQPLVDQYGADGLIVADCNIEAECDTLVAQGKALANLAGPYYGRAEKVVGACARAGVHYLDLTGELIFVRSIIDDYHETAQASGARIAPVAGYEALPFDLMALKLLEAYQDTYGDTPTHIDLLSETGDTPDDMDGLGDAISGGTAQTMRVMLENDFSGLSMDPTALNPADDPNRDTIRQAMPYHMRPLPDDPNPRTSPIFPGPFLHPAVFNRTVALLRLEQKAIGTNLRYRERMSLGDDVGKGTLYGMAGAARFMQWLTSTKSTFVRKIIRKLFDKAAPVPGEGPDVAKLDDWHWGLSGIARGKGGNSISLSMKGEGHPGYRTTANMMAEAALILADDNAEKPARGGVLTPASAIGTATLDRFARAGMTFSDIETGG
jgi:short subunit dehydrogenase-like uncharacterized protein